MPPGKPAVRFTRSEPRRAPPSRCPRQATAWRPKESHDEGSRTRVSCPMRTERCTTDPSLHSSPPPLLSRYCCSCSRRIRVSEAPANIRRRLREMHAGFARGSGEYVGRHDKSHMFRMEIVYGPGDTIIESYPERDSRRPIQGGWEGCADNADRELPTKHATEAWRISSSDHRR